jgi:hypothetical protein
MRKPLARQHIAQPMNGFRVAIKIRKHKNQSNNLSS